MYGFIYVQYIQYAVYGRCLNQKYNFISKYMPFIFKGELGMRFWLHVLLEVFSESVISPEEKEKVKGFLGRRTRRKIVREGDR